jgi:anthranilate phosphoribosyltransferase
MAFQPYLRRITEHGETLDRDEAAELMQLILAGQVPDLQIGALLAALAARGETAAEIAGFAAAMRSAAQPLPLNDDERANLVDACGTGGDGSGTFNISTAAALVAAAAGATVAKHGNRAVTSQCGSADVLAALGIPTTLSGQAAADALRRHRFCFLHAPSHHPAMKAVMPIRRALGVRTVFNILGPLLNPAGARRQVMGVYAARLLPVVGEAMTMLDTEHALVVHGEGGLDELALSGPSHAAEVRAGDGVRLRSIAPEDIGLTRAPLAALAGGNAQTNAAILCSIFAGQSGPHRDVVLLNAAAVLYVAAVAPDLPTAATLAAEAIDSGSVTELVSRLSA